MIRCHRIDPGSIPGQSISFTFFCSLADRLFIICSHVLLRGRGRKKDSPMARLELATFWLICVRVRRSKPIEPHGTCLTSLNIQHITIAVNTYKYYWDSLWIWCPSTAIGELTDNTKTPLLKVSLLCEELEVSHVLELLNNITWLLETMCTKIKNML